MCRYRVLIIGVFFCFSNQLLAQQTVSEYCQDIGFLNAIGTGDAQDPYQIVDICQLQAISSTPNAHYVLANYIDASITGVVRWVPIGGSSGFSGSFSNLANYSIYGLTSIASTETISSTSENITGMFSILTSSSVVSRIILERAQIGGYGIVGGLSGINRGIIEECQVILSDIEQMFWASYSFARRSGGMAGRNDGDSAIIRDSHFTGFVDGILNAYSGGIAGENRNGATIQKSSAIATVSGVFNTAVGGVAGYNTDESVIRQSYANVTIDGKRSLFAGGLVGINGGNSTISNTYALGVIATNSSVVSGTLVGGNYSSNVENSYAFSDAGVNPFIGTNDTGDTVRSSFGTNISIDGLASQRTVEQLRCPTFAGENCQNAVTFSNWDRSIWYFGTSTTLPQLIFDPVILTVSPTKGGTVFGDTGGIDCGTTCHGIYPSGKIVQLTAVADEPHRFNGWGDDCRSFSQNNILLLDLNSDQMCTAFFKAYPRILNIQVFLSGAL